MLLAEIVDQAGTTADFIGHAGGDNFIIITTEQAALAIRERLKSRFDEEIPAHYNFLDREKGFIQMPEGGEEAKKIPLMTLAIGTLSASEGQFADIREITEFAAEARRRDPMTK
jgi:GGDEF domain-containing protein